MVSDPIADLLTRIRNGASAKHRYVDVNWSKMKQRIVEILRDQGFVEGYLVKDQGGLRTMRIFLKYASGRMPVIQGLRRRSKPGSRRYVSKEQIRPVLGGIGLSIVSTSKGVMTGREATQAGVGGELLCEVW
jgi:small subunit ribosomal protein S8